MLLKKFIQVIEEHTGEKFDFSKRRHRHLLDGQIDRLHQRELNQLGAIRNILEESNNCFQLYNDATHYVVKRR